MRELWLGAEWYDARWVQVGTATMEYTRRVVEDQENLKSLS